MAAPDDAYDGMKRGIAAQMATLEALKLLLIRNGVFTAAEYDAEFEKQYRRIREAFDMVMEAGGEIDRLTDPPKD